MHQRAAFRIALSLTLSLLIAQFGATAHAYSHDAQMSGAPARDPAARQSNSGSHDFCSDCLNFAPLLAAAAPPAGVPFILPRTVRLPFRNVHRSRDDDRPLLAFRSRAPPLTR